MQSLKLGDVVLHSPLWNAGGTCKSKKDIDLLVKTRVGAIEYGSITAEPRDGNPGTVIHVNDDGNSLNSIGLKNEGVAYYMERLPWLVEIARGYGKPFFLNIAGSNPSDFIVLASLALAAKVDAMVVNLSCPNAHDANALLCFQLDTVGMVLNAVRRGSENKIPLIPKISPITDPSYRATLVRFLASFPEVAAIASCNTFPGCWDCDDEGKSYISGTGYAGGAGDQLFQFNLGQVRSICHLLNQEGRGRDIPVIGIGGVTDGRRAHQYIRAGARFVAMHTAARNPQPPYQLLPDAFDRVSDELSAIILTN